MFFFLSALFAVATIALLIEFFRNPLTHAGHATAKRSRGFVTDYATVLRSPWARLIIAWRFIESAFMFGAFTYVGADLHLRFGVSFAVVGLFVGAFAIGGLIYSLSVRRLVGRLRADRARHRRRDDPRGRLHDNCICAARLIAPFAITAIGLGFYMLHNTLQTNATQMTPEARGTAVAIFSSALYLGQTAGRRHQRNRFRPIHRGAGVPDCGDGFAGAGIVVCAKLRRHAKKLCHSGREQSERTRIHDHRPGIDRIRAFRRVRNAPEFLRPAARDALDLRAHDALDHAGQIVIKP